jgi:hypothetical protein
LPREPAQVVGLAVQQHAFLAGLEHADAVGQFHLRGLQIGAQQQPHGVAARHGGQPQRQVLHRVEVGRRREHHIEGPHLAHPVQPE